MVRHTEQRWKPVASTGTGRVRPVKPVEIPVKFFFFATKRHRNTNRNILIHFIINITFYKKNSINKPHLLKTLAEWFQAVTNMLRPLRHAHPGAYLGSEYCAMPPFGPRHKAKKCKIYDKIAHSVSNKACMWKRLALPGNLASL